MEHDFFLAFPREGSKGVRVKVRWMMTVCFEDHLLVSHCVVEAVRQIFKVTADQMDKHKEGSRKT